jgi:hypothetical protein
MRELSRNEKPDIFMEYTTQTYAVEESPSRFKPRSRMYSTHHANIDAVEKLDHIFIAHPESAVIYNYKLLDVILIDVSSSIQNQVFKTERFYNHVKCRKYSPAFLWSTGETYHSSHPSIPWSLVTYTHHAIMAYGNI